MSFAIETNRLIIRQWQDSDIAPFAVLNQDIRVMEHFPKTLTVQESQRFVDDMHQAIANQGYGFFAVERKDSGEFIGSVGLAHPRFQMHFTPCVEIGWKLAFCHWGNGYAKEAAFACLDLGFNTLKLKEIFAFTARVNTRSISVMEKIGMTRDSHDDFQHPNIAYDHPLSWHVLYRKGNR